MELVVRILVRLYLGMLVMVLPWLSLWTQNNLFTYSNLLEELSGNGFVRGLVSGLGLLNMILAIASARYIRTAR